MREFQLIWSLIDEATQRKLVLLQVLNVIAGLLQLAGVGSILPFMAMLMEPNVVKESEYLSIGYELLGFSEPRDFLIFLGVFMFVGLATSNLTTSISSYLEDFTVNGIRHDLSVRLFRAYLKQPYNWFLDKNSSEILRNIFGVAQSVVGGFLQPLSQCLSTSVRAILLLALVFAIDPVAATAATLLLVLIYLVIYRFLRQRLSDYGIEKLKISREINLSITEAVGGIKELKVLNREQFFLNRFEIVSSRLANISSKEKWLASVPRKFMETIIFGGIIGLVIYSANQEGGAEDTLPLLSLYALSSIRVLPALQSIYSTASSFRANIPAARLLYEHIHSAESGAQEIPNSPRLEFREQIQLNDITFHYPSRSTPALEEVSVSIKKNTSVAFAGTTGSGKTTLIDIILGLHSPSGGSIMVDERRLSEAVITGWQKQVGYVPQSIFLIDSTIRANIAMGRHKSDIDQKKIEKVAEIAKIHEFISELPRGYDTVVGERGVKMSGGQRQRLGLARALYNDPSVLILDEATSALDGVTERTVMDAIESLSGEITLIIIAHRLTTLKNCDKIYLMEDGRIRDSGTYNELQERSKMFQIPAGVTPPIHTSNESEEYT